MEGRKQIGVFPKGFLWGAATSSHQIEGGLNNNWSKWEETRAKKAVDMASRSGLTGQALEVENYLSNSKYSCMSSRYFKEDVKVLKELGLKAYRFSIEWSRIEPKKGVFDFEGLEYYKNLVRELKRNNIEPVVTLWHWTVPLWLEKEGGVFAKNFKEYFLRMSKQVLEILSDEVVYWVTFNEPEVYAASSYLTGWWPPNERNSLKAFWFNYVVFPRVHKRVYKVIKGYNSKALVSFSKQNPFNEPYDSKIWNVLVTKIFTWFTNFLQIDLVRNSLDYIALNYYFHNKLGVKGMKNDNDRVTDLGWWFKPESIEYAVCELWNRYKLPIMITENGLADSEDKYRKEWIETTMKAMRNCLDLGVNLIGYLHWSLLDNFEWAHGFWPKFGLVSVDPKTKKRIIKESGIYYSKIVKKNGII